MALLGVQSAFLNMWMCVAEHSKHVFRVIRFFHPSTHAHPRIRSFSQSQVSLEVWSLVFHHIFHVMGEEKAMPALQTGETKIQIPDQTHVSLDLQNHLPTSFLFCFVFFFNWRKIGSQCYVGFCNTITWISHSYTCPLPLKCPSHCPPSPSRSSQSSRLSSLCFAAASCQPSGLHMEVPICQCYALSPSHPLLSLLSSQACSQ